ncbi:MAG: (2Fe-2S)-binding protein [Acidobacteria bacterium]|nr:(2Fe-2S)-binding protein [Acidobacteriota bacterium]
MEGTFRINGRHELLEFSERATLLQVLRDNGHQEVKEGCAEGQCGSCLVLLDGRLVNSCQVFAAAAVNREITTVQGLGTIHAPHAIQEALVEVGAVQCGFCTPGMVMAAYYLLRHHPDPSEKEIRRALDGNLCRCTGYTKIIEGIRLAARRMRQA